MSPEPNLRDVFVRAPADTDHTLAFRLLLRTLMLLCWICAVCGMEGATLYINNDSGSTRWYEFYTQSPLYVDGYGDTVSESSDYTRVTLAAGQKWSFDLPEIRAIEMNFTGDIIVTKTGLNPHLVSIIVNDSGTGAQTFAVFGKGAYTPATTSTDDTPFKHIIAILLLLLTLGTIALAHAHARK